MSEVLFFEKPGCIGNARQKRRLVALGHRLRVRDLLTEPWTAERLRPFFGDLPVAQWFNPTAPRVRDGLLDPAKLDEAAALALLLREPLLIRRPLIESEHGRCCGFEPNPVLRALGVHADGDEQLEGCAHPRPSYACEPACTPAAQAPGQPEREADPR